MIVSFVKIDDLSTPEIDFFSVILNVAELCEFELFDQFKFPDHQEELEILYNIIDEIRVRGAKTHYFKPESGAHALPYVGTAIKKANKKDFGLRLYCIRLTHNLVILLNGGIKTHKNPSECPNVALHFNRAVKIARRLDKLLINKEVNYEGTESLLDLEIEI